MSRRYFGGDTVKGTVRQLKATSFKELVERYFDTGVAKPFTRREFNAADTDTQKIYKDGFFVTPAVFNGNDVPRQLVNCTAVCLAMLDFDSVTEHERKEGFVDYATQFHDAPEFVRNALYPYNFVCHETISSKPGNRRVRIIVDLQEMEPAMHRPAVRRIADLLGVTTSKWKGRTESMVLHQPMFRPAQFQDENYAAILCSRTDGQELEELDIPEIDDIGEDGERNYGWDGSGSADDDLMHMPVPGLSVDDVREVLKHLDADKDYWDWIKTGMALRHQFRGEEEAKAAFELFDEWSQEGTGGKYVDADESYQKWKTFRPDRTFGRATTIRTVFEKAKAAGWDPAPMGKKVKRSIKSWIDKQVDPDEIMLHAPNKIAAMPFKDEMIEEALCIAIQKRVKAISPDGELNLTLATIKKSLRQARRQKKQDDNSDMPAWLRPWVYITTRNIFRHLGSGIELTPEGFNNTFSVELMSTDKDSESMATGRPSVMPVHFALNVMKGKRVDGTTYDPRHGGEEPFFEHNGRLYLNEYRLSTVPKLDPTNARKAGKIFCNGVKALVGEEHFKIMMDFFAHTVQRPGKLIRWAPLIHSGEGAGKNMICRIVGYAIGMENFKPLNAQKATGTFNDWVAGAQFIALDEIKVSGQSRMELMGALKDLITNDEVSVEAKHQALKLVQNVANKIAFTNVLDALYLEDSDRRWFPIKSPIQRKAQQAELVRAGHFKKLAKLYKHGGAIRQFLLDWEIDPEFPTDGPAPMTEFRDEMILDSKNRLQEAIEDLMEEAKHPMVARDIIFARALEDALPQDATRNNHRPAHFLQQMGFRRYRSGHKFMISGVRGAIWVHDGWDDSQDPFPVLKERSELDDSIDDL